MCGRYRLTARERYLRDRFGLDQDISWSPRWNIAPTQQVPVVRQHKSEARRTFDLVRWGLIPYWTKDPFHRNENHKRNVRNRRRETYIPGCHENAAVFSSG
jgi:putative SOS response-associated peptidase YedK